MNSNRFILLDGLRGIAALGVVIMHFTQHGNHMPLFQSAGLAVDLFFCLSGFVIAWSYYEKLRAGMKFSLYVKKRLIRLYPMFIIGLFFGVIAFLFKFSLKTNEYSIFDIFLATLINSVYLPYFVDSVPGRIDGIFLVNSPAWSLFFELVANLLFVLTVKLSRNMLICITIPFGMWLIYVGILFDTTPGWSTINFVGGFPRVGYSFMVGVLLYKFSYKFESIPKLNPIIISVILIAMLLLPLADVVQYWVFSSLIILPLIVLFGGHSVVAQNLLSKSFTYLGYISYPLYCLHKPFLVIWDSINPFPDHYYRSLLILAIFTIMVTHFLAKYVDEPIRMSLGKKYT
jgi:peptidoglycan/LPS O-acetylase OafA/YrhL